MTKEAPGLSDSERERYASQIDGELGVEGQLRLKQARAIVIGAGTVGAAAAAQLASCGVGYVAVVDGARVALGDLAGQALYYTPDLGHAKADVLAAKLGLLNPEVQVDSYPVALDERNAAAIVAEHDLILDCTHDMATGTVLDRTGAPVLRLPPARPADALRALARAPAEALT